MTVFEYAMYAHASKHMTPDELREAQRLAEIVEQSQDRKTGREALLALKQLTLDVIIRANAEEKEKHDAAMASR